MPKYLQLSVDSPQQWRLPPDTDVEKLEKTLTTAMEEGSTALVLVETSDNPRTVSNLWVNGRTLVAAVVIDLPEHGEIGFGR